VSKAVNLNFLRNHLLGLVSGFFAAYPISPFVVRRGKVLVAGGHGLRANAPDHQVVDTRHKVYCSGECARPPRFLVGGHNAGQPRNDAGDRQLHKGCPHPACAKEWIAPTHLAVAILIVKDFERAGERPLVARVVLLLYEREALLLARAIAVKRRRQRQKVKFHLAPWRVRHKLPKDLSLTVFARASLMETESVTAVLRLRALDALLDHPEHVVVRINALDEESIAIVAQAAALKCHEVLWDDTEHEQPKKRNAAWKALRRAQKVQRWLFDQTWQRHLPAPETVDVW
tara:strand:+ start:655 stop:1515 length:861 start_codon:yes stop_codon:yes gene_type:complete